MSDKKMETGYINRYNSSYENFMRMEGSYLLRIECAAKYFASKQNVKTTDNVLVQLALLFALVTPITAITVGLLSFNPWFFALICITCSVTYVVAGGMIMFEKIILKLLFNNIVISTKRQMIIDVLLQIDKDEMSPEAVASCSKEIDRQVQAVIEKVEKQHG